MQRGAKKAKNCFADFQQVTKYIKKKNKKKTAKTIQRIEKLRTFASF